MSELPTHQQLLPKGISQALSVAFWCQCSPPDSRYTVRTRPHALPGFDLARLFLVAAVLLSFLRNSFCQRPSFLRHIWAVPMLQTSLRQIEALHSPPNARPRRIDCKLGLSGTSEYRVLNIKTDQGIITSVTLTTMSSASTSSIALPTHSMSDCRYRESRA
jgi:hypothetical protein